MNNIIVYPSIRITERPIFFFFNRLMLFPLFLPMKLLFSQVRPARSRTTNRISELKNQHFLMVLSITGDPV